MSAVSEHDDVREIEDAVRLSALEACVAQMRDVLHRNPDVMHVLVERGEMTKELAGVMVEVSK